jgi:ribosomal protein L7/L12
MKIELTEIELQAVLQTHVNAVTAAKIQLQEPTFTSRSLLLRLSGAFAASQNGQKIAAIKLIREATGCGLKEAKDVVEGNFI